MNILGEHVYCGIAWADIKTSIQLAQVCVVHARLRSVDTRNGQHNNNYYYYSYYTLIMVGISRSKVIN